MTRSRRRQAASFRPALETLEDRNLLSTYTVDRLTDLNQGSGLAGDLRYCISQTAGGDTITFGVEGTITLTSGELRIAKDLTIAGPRPDVLTVSGNGASGVFNIAAAVNVAISGLTIADGTATTQSGGGGISNAGTLVLTDCTVRGNSAVFEGGGIYQSNRGTLTVTDSTFSGNTVGNYEISGSGGAIFSLGTLTVIDSTFSGNVADGFGDGGGIWSEFGTLTVTHSTFSGNSAGDGGGLITFGPLTTIDHAGFIGNTAGDAVSGGGGGGVYCMNGTVSIRNSTFAANSAGSGGGGGIFNNTSSFTVTDSTFSGNSASDGTGANGGGAIVTGGSSATISNSTFSGNSAPRALNNGGGGAAIKNEGLLTLLESTFSGNTCASYGGTVDTQAALTIISSTIVGNDCGGIFEPGTHVTRPRNSIIAGNTAQNAADVHGALISQGHNLIGDGTGGSGYDATDLVGTSANPIDPGLGPLQDNGGPTPTMAPLLGSPALAAGDLTDAPPTDQRGAPRVVNGSIDIGAYQVQAAPAPSCALAQPLLWPPDQSLVTVGLSFQLNDDADPSTHLFVQVYANDNATTSDAADIAPDTLQLRAERQHDGQGRVYLIVVTASDASGQTGFDVCAAVVPRHHGSRSVASAQRHAAAAEAYYQQLQTAPPGYVLIGESPHQGGGSRVLGRSGRDANPGDIFRLTPPVPISPRTAPTEGAWGGMADATAAAELSPSAWASPPLDAYFAAADTEGFRLTTLRFDQAGWQEASGLVPDLLGSCDLTPRLMQMPLRYYPGQEVPH